MEFPPDLFSCKSCEFVMDPPLVFPKCGHTSYCAQCVTSKNLRTCPECQMSHKGISFKRFPINRKLHHVMNLLGLLEETTAIEETEATTTQNSPKQSTDIRCCKEIEAIQTLVLSLSESHILPKTYVQDASEIIRREHSHPSGKAGIMVKCKCGLVCLPKASRKRTAQGKQRWFFGCPGFHPTSTKVSGVSDMDTRIIQDITRPDGLHSIRNTYYCGQFQWVSHRQLSKLNIKSE
jgi:hypothetical protein